MSIVLQSFSCCGKHQNQIQIHFDYLGQEWAAAVVAAVAAAVGYFHCFGPQHQLLQFGGDDLHEVEFADGTRDKVTANIIAENMYAQIDDHGNQYALLSEIQDHKKDGTALTEEDSWDYRGANKTRKQTTKGWQLLVAWKDGSSSWVKLKDVKDSNPIEVAEYAVANRIQDEPAFAWWVKQVLRRRNRIISKA